MKLLSKKKTDMEETFVTEDVFKFLNYLCVNGFSNNGSLKAYYFIYGTAIYLLAFR